MSESRIDACLSAVKARAQERVWAEEAPSGVRQIAPTYAEAKRLYALIPDEEEWTDDDDEIKPGEQMSRALLIVDAHVEREFGAHIVNRMRWSRTLFACSRLSDCDAENLAAIAEFKDVFGIDLMAPRYCERLDKFYRGIGHLSFLFHGSLLRFGDDFIDQIDDEQLSNFRECLGLVRDPAGRRERLRVVLRNTREIRDAVEAKYLETIARVFPEALMPALRPQPKN